MAVYSESFETGLGLWTNDPTSKTGWQRISGPTPSSFTGPSSGAYDGDYYIYVETSDPYSYYSGDTDIIEFDMSGFDASGKHSGNVDFYYHQYSSHAGTLYFEGYDGATWEILWSSTGNQGDVWLNANVLFSGKTKLRFRNVAAGGYQGDTSLDLIVTTYTVVQQASFSDDGSVSASSNAVNLTFRDSDSGSADITSDAENLTRRISDTGSADITSDAENLTRRLSDSGSADVSSDAENLTRRLSDSGTASAGTTNIQSIFNRSIDPQDGSASIESLAGIVAERSISDDGSANVATSILNYTEFKASYLEYAVERFYITLTGAEDSTMDIDIPISNFNARFQTGNPTYLTVTIPAFADYATAVAARSNGQIILTAYYEWLGDTLLTQEILRVDLQNINTFEGANSKSIVLDGYKTQSPVGQTIELDYLQYREVQGGTTTLRFPRIDFFLRPGDTLTAGSTTITVGAIQYTVTSNSRSMSVSE